MSDLYSQVRRRRRKRQFWINFWAVVGLLLFFSAFLGWLIGRFS